MVWLIATIVLLVVVLFLSVSGGVRYLSESKHFKELFDRAERDRMDLYERFWDAEYRHQEIEGRLREQIQHLSERLSTLRVEKGAVPEQDRFVEDPKPAEPYSQQLTDFLLGIEFEDARQLVEEEIDLFRSQDLSDEQIYDIISKGD